MTASLADIAGGFVSGVGLMAAWLWRTRLGDGRTDQIDRRMTELIELLKTQAETQAKRADHFSGERMELASQVGRLTAELTAKNREIELLSAEMADLRANISGLQQLMNWLMRDSQSALPEEARQLLAGWRPTVSMEPTRI